MIHNQKLGKGEQSEIYKYLVEVETHQLKGKNLI